MAIQVQRVRICDVCGSDQDVCRFRISKLEGDARTVTVDLCGSGGNDHSQPLEGVLKVKPVPRRKARAVTPIREVTARRATKRTARKRT